MDTLNLKFREPKDRKLGKRHDLGVQERNFKPKGNCPRCQKFHLEKPCKGGNQGCYTCGKNDHVARVCPKGPVCFNCQQSNHLDKHCLQRREVNKLNKRNQEPLRGRVFNLIREYANADPIVIQGTLTFLNTLVQVLIDPGFIHSFISHVLALYLELESRKTGLSNDNDYLVKKTSKNLHGLQGWESHVGRQRICSQTKSLGF